MLHGIIEYQIRKMKKCNTLYHSITMLFFTTLLSSCLKETAVPIESAFTIETSEDKTSPVTIQLKNESYGADEYEWTFEGDNLVVLQTKNQERLYSHRLVSTKLPCEFGIV